MSRKDRDNCTNYVVLDHEHIVQFQVVPFGPTVGAGHGIHELRRDADAVTHPPDATL